jgi:hypothetical protein
MRQLETVQERMRKMTQDELSRYQLDNRLGGMSEVIAYKVSTRGASSHPPTDSTGLDTACIPALPTNTQVPIRLCSAPPHAQALQRLYGEKIEDIMEGLRKTPAAAVPVVLRRCAETPSLGQAGREAGRLLTNVTPCPLLCPIGLRKRTRSGGGRASIGRRSGRRRI